MTVETIVALDRFFNGEPPDWVLEAGKSFITVQVADDLFGSRSVKVRLEDVARYYRTEAGNLLSGCRTLAGIIGDWRPIDHLANICLEWFKAVNVEGIRRAARRFGLEPTF